MRYGNPSTPDALKRLLDQGVDDLFIIPMYPHYAMSSYETAVVALMDAVKEQKPELKTTLLPPFYQEPGYIDAMIARAQPSIEGHDFDKLVFSFHGIPQRHLVKGDPSHNHCLTTHDCCNTCHPAHATCYRHQCAMTVEKFVAAANLPKDKYMITFQSRLGREPWLQPYTDKTLEQLAKDGHKKVKVICPAFTADCLETLEEIAMQGRDSFLESGGEDFEQIPCLNESPAFIDFLAEKVQGWRDGAYESPKATPPAYVERKS
jgi:ferrochelatase